MAIDPQAGVSNAWSARRGVRASAGSGKTYDLTGHYLRWLLLGADPAGMLATTFTRKAASEILGRALTRLAEACHSEDQLAALAAELALPGLSLKEARDHLIRLCLALDRISVSTIDSFFARLLSAFRHELGLPADLRVVDGNSLEMARIRRDAIAVVLANENKEELLDLLIDLHRGSATQRVASDLERRLSSAHEIFQTAPPEAWDAVAVPDGLLDTPALVQALRSFEEACLSLRDNRQSKAATKEIGLIVAGEWEALFAGGMAAKILAGSASYYAPIPEEVVRAYEPVIAHARAAVIGRHVAHTKALYHLLALYHEAYTKLCARERVVEFGDVPLALARLLSQRPPSEIGSRLDAAIRHLLLDEFQDTDPEQYAILKPFADAISALPKDQGLIYCVGDLKQSIYGWRGATPQIFERFGVDMPDVAWSDNDISYRSAQVVLDAVNRLFGTLTQNAVLCERNPQAGSLWQSRFHDHTAKKGLAGFVQLLQSPGAATETDEEAINQETDPVTADPHMEFCARKVAEIVKEAPWASIGVLMRTGDAVRRMIFSLSRLGVSASAEGGSPIDDDPAVGIILSALIFADHPSDTTAQFHALNSPLASTLRLGGEDTPSASAVALAIRRQLMREGYAATITAWSTELVKSCDQRGTRRLLQLIEIADEFDRRPGARPMDFVEFVRAQSVEEPQPSAVRVMTIHKAKGLEFDAVVLPELQMSLQRAPTLVYQRDPQTLKITAVSSYPNKIVRAMEPQLAAMCEEHVAQEVREALCLLYVAMTRARQALYIITPAVETKQDGAAKAPRFSLANIVRAGLAGSESLTDLSLQEELYAHGDPEWHHHPPEPSKQAVPKDNTGKLDPPALDLTGLPPRIWRNTTPSSLVADPEGVEIDDQARRRGLALHAMLAQVEWSNKSLPDENILIHAARTAEPILTEDDLVHCMNEFRGMVWKPAFWPAFSQPKMKSDERVELWREREFIQLLDGNLVSGIFDRVTLIFKGDQPVRAHLTEFKTGQVEENQIRSEAERYRPQIELYRAALCAMTGLSPRDVRASIVFTACGESITLYLRLCNSK
jgi:ATP-dependent exoDNAse (exonuclease V) beta subunit